MIFSIRNLSWPHVQQINPIKPYKRQTLCGAQTFSSFFALVFPVVCCALLTNRAQAHLSTTAKKNLIKTTLLLHKSKQILLCLLNFNFHLTLRNDTCSIPALNSAEIYKIDNQIEISPQLSKKEGRTLLIVCQWNEYRICCTHCCLMCIST